MLSLDEYVDLRLARELDEAELADLVLRMSAASPAGLAFRAAVRLRAEDPSVTRVIAGARYVLAFARSAVEAKGQSAEALLAERCAAALAATSLPWRRQIEGVGKMLDVRTYLLTAEVAGPEALAAVARAGLVGDLVAIDVHSAILPNGAVKAAELAAVIMGGGEGEAAPPHRAVRVELFGEDEAGHFSPMTLGRGRKPKPVVAVEAAVSADAE